MLQLWVFTEGNLSGDCGESGTVWCTHKYIQRFHRFQQHMQGIYIRLVEHKVNTHSRCYDRKISDHDVKPPWVQGLESQKGSKAHVKHGFTAMK